MTLVSDIASPGNSPEDPKLADLPPALRPFARMIGGTWHGVLKGERRDFIVESMHERALQGQAVRTRYVFDMGGPWETEGEATVGWDPVKGEAYYLEFHGPHEVFQGTAAAKGDGALLEFRSIVGPPVHARARIELTDPDTMRFTRYGLKDGEWAETFGITYERRR